MTLLTKQAFRLPGEREISCKMRPFISADESEFVLIIAWLLSTLQPSGAYPILQIKREQGSAKSTTSKLIGN